MRPPQILKDGEHVLTRVVDYGAVEKVPRTGYGAAILDREWEVLTKWKLPTECGFVPPVGHRPDGTLVFPDVGPHVPPADEAVALVCVIQVLEALWRAGVRHGDLTSANMIWDGVRLWVIDWGDATRVEERPRKQPLRDVVTGLGALVDWSADTSRIARRWRAIVTDLGLAGAGPGEVKPAGHLVDWGCNVGLMTRLARISGFRVTAVDRDRSALMNLVGLDAPTVDIRHADIGIDPGPIPRDSVGLLLSVLPYVIRDHGEDRAIAMVQAMVAQHSRLYVECQQEGDGPGMLASQAQWGRWFEAAVPTATVEAVVTLPVAGRHPHERTVWRIE